MSFNACSHKTSGLRSPAFASSMILSAMACLTKSSEPSVRRAMQTISNATPKTRRVSGSHRLPFRKGLIGMSEPRNALRDGPLGESKRYKVPNESARYPITH